MFCDGVTNAPTIPGSCERSFFMSIVCYLLCLVLSVIALSVPRDGPCVDMCQDVAFWPPLPATKLKAFQRMGLCQVAKVVLKFDRPAFPPLLHGCICSESFIPEFWFRYYCRAC